MENGGEYKISVKTIKPNQSIEIDIKKLQDDQTPDFKDTTIPLNAVGGQIRWTLHQHEMPSMSEEINLP